MADVQLRLKHLYDISNTVLGTEPRLSAFYAASMRETAFRRGHVISGTVQREFCWRCSVNIVAPITASYKMVSRKKKKHRVENEKVKYVLRTDVPKGSRCKKMLMECKLCRAKTIFQGISKAELDEIEAPKNSQRAAVSEPPKVQAIQPVAKNNNPIPKASAKRPKKKNNLKNLLAASASRQTESMSLVDFLKQM